VNRPEPSVEEPRVVRADNAGLFALGGTRSYVVGRRRVAVVDPGPDDPAHLAALEEAVSRARSGVVLLTHGHPDHAAGAPTLARRTGFALRGGSALADGEEISTDGGTLRVVATPGHSRDHVAFYLVERSELLVGDLLLGEGSTTWVGEYAGCVADYLRSLDRVARLGPSRLLPAHGPPLDDPDEAVRRYRAHRTRRIRQVEEALGRLGSDLDPAGAQALERLVHEIYGSDLPAGLREGARWSLRAILHHLEVVPFPPEGAPTEGGDGLI
jgi:glyoxylase-like metal-dependent hydrolase (beta-lactamase superfamily II)